MPLDDLRRGVVAQDAATTFERGYVRGVELQSEAEVGAFRQFQMKDLLVRMGQEAEKTKPETVAAALRFLDIDKPPTPEDAALLVRSGIYFDTLKHRTDLIHLKAAADADALRLAIEKENLRQAEERTRQMGIAGTAQAAEDAADLQLKQLALETAKAEAEKGTTPKAGAQPKWTDVETMRDVLRTNMLSGLPQDMVEYDEKGAARVKEDYRQKFGQAVNIAAGRHNVGDATVRPDVIQEAYYESGLMKRPGTEKEEEGGGFFGLFGKGKRKVEDMPTEEIRAHALEKVNRLLGIAPPPPQWGDEEMPEEEPMAPTPAPVDTTSAEYRREQKKRRRKAEREAELERRRARWR